MGQEVTDALLKSASSALENAELCFRENKFDATVRESILAIENAANALVISLGGAYVSSHYEYQRAMKVMAQRRWKLLLSRPVFKEMLKIVDLTEFSVNSRYPISVVEGEIRIREKPTKEKAEKFLKGARYFLKNAIRYINEYKSKQQTKSSRT